MIWSVALGSALGGVCRWLIGTAFQRPGFPVWTLAINVAGSFLLGAILRGSLQTPSISPELRAMLTIGFCGGFTTFSTFSYETATLIEDGQWVKAALYIGGSVVLSIAAMFMGFATAREVVAMSARG